MWHSLPIRYKLLAIIAGPLIISILMTTIISGDIMRELVTKRIVNEEIPIILDNVAQGVEKEINQILVASKAMANNTLITSKSIAKDDAKSLIEFLAHTKSTEKSVSAFYISGENNNYYKAEGFVRQLSRESKADSWFYNFIDSDKPYHLTISLKSLTLFVNYRTYDGRSIAGVGMSMPNVKNSSKTLKLAKMVILF